MGKKESPAIVDFELIQLIEIFERRAKLGLPSILEVATPEDFAKAFKKAGEMLRENGRQSNIGEGANGDSEFCRRRQE